MKTRIIATGAVTAALIFFANSAFAQVRVLDQHVIYRVLPGLKEVDFENLPTYEGRRLPGQPRGHPNPLTLNGITFFVPGAPYLTLGFCSSPSCVPDPHNASGGNKVLSLRASGSISFTQFLRVVVLDVQGMGDNPFVLVVTDGRGFQKTVAGQGTLEQDPWDGPVTLIGLYSLSGISKIEVQSVGSISERFVLARVLFAEDVRQNSCPAGNAQVINVAADSSINITLTAADADRDPLSYELVQAPANGTITGSAPNLTYTPAPGYGGPDSLTFLASDGICDSPAIAVTINVIPNECPTAVAKVSPNLIFSKDQTNVIAIADCAGLVCLRLDGSLSHDPDGDVLTYYWLVDHLPAESPDGAAVTNCLKTGSYEITLVVDDARCASSATLEIEVITVREAVEKLIDKVMESNLPRRHQRPLIVTLKAAARSFDHGKFRAGRWQLHAFIHQVRAQVSRTNPVLAEDLIQIALQILQQADCDKKLSPWTKELKEHWRDKEILRRVSDK